MLHCSPCIWLLPTTPTICMTHLCTQSSVTVLAFVLICKSIRKHTATFEPLLLLCPWARMTPRKIFLWATPSFPSGFCSDVALPDHPVSTTSLHSIPLPWFHSWPSTSHSYHVMSFSPCECKLHAGRDLSCSLICHQHLIYWAQIPLLNEWRTSWCSVRRSSYQ